jgi:hypothetical protein
VPQAVRHDWTVESAFARIKGFCDDACLALANERATGEHSAHTARREIVSATWETFDPAIRDAVSSRLLGLLRSVSAQEDGWIFRMNADLAMLGALPGDGDDLERFDRAMKEDIAAYAQILTEVKAWTDQS